MELTQCKGYFDLGNWIAREKLVPNNMLPLYYIEWSGIVRFYYLSIEFHEKRSHFFLGKARVTAIALGSNLDKLELLGTGVERWKILSCV